MQYALDLGDGLFVRSWRPRRPDRLFFGLFPDTEASIWIKRFADRFLWENPVPGARLKTERLHISLHHVGDYPRLRGKFIYAAVKAGDAISVPPFPVTCRLITSLAATPPKDGRPPTWPLVLSCEGEELYELHGMLGAAMRDIGLRSKESFLPHMTLLYGSKPISPQVIEPFRFWAREVTLIHSYLGLTRYDTIERWPLRA